MVLLGVPRGLLLGVPGWLGKGWGVLALFGAAWRLPWASWEHLGDVLGPSGAP